MKPPRKAIVLAAGYGARLLPLTLCRPKPLCPIWGKPALAHALEHLQRWGVCEVLINVHCHGGKIVDYLRLHPMPGLRCQVSFEPDILGTGGALTRARWFLDRDPFWLMNADVLADVPSAPLLRAFDAHAALAALWLLPDAGPRTVETVNGVITSFRSARAGTEGTATFSGLHLLSPRLLRYLPDGGENSIIDAYERAMRQGERIAGVTVPGAYWADIGNPASYLQAHWDIQARAAAGRPGGRLYDAASAAAPARPDVSGSCAIGRRVSVAPSASVGHSVLWDDVTVHAGASVNHAVLADKVSVRGTVSYLALRADTLEEPELSSVLGTLGWAPERTTVLPLPPRGSARTFTRLVAGHRRAILVQYQIERPENALYSAHARFLDRVGVRVPRVLLDNPRVQLCVLEDAGETALQDLVPRASSAQCLKWYRAVLDNVILLHARAHRAARRARLPLNPPFDAATYHWEQDLFCDKFLVPHVRPDADTLAVVRRELAGLIPALLDAPAVLVHRDLQSSNILMTRGQPVLIDFQGMRLGPAAYDLASLLCDPYVNLPPDLRDRLLDEYAHRAPGGTAARALFWTAAVERLCQALGAYGRLGATPATAGFLRHIPAGLAQLLNALDHVTGLPTLHRLLAHWQATRP